MLLIDSLNSIHEDKLLAVVERHIDAGRKAEVRQALPGLIETRPNLSGQLKEILARLNTDVPAPDMIASEHGVAFTCAHCGGALSKQLADSQLVLCQYCGNDASKPAASDSIKWAEKLDPQARFSIGSKFNFLGQKWQAVAVQRYRGKIKEWDREDKDWETNPASYTLWWMLNEKRELAWLSDYGSKRYWSEKYIPQQPEIPDSRDRKIEHGRFRLLLASGEFSYAPVPNEYKQTWEYKKRPNKKETAKDPQGNNYTFGVEALLDGLNKPTEFEFIRSIEISNSEVIEGIGAGDELQTIKRWKKTGIALFAAGALSFVLGMAFDLLRTGDQLVEHRSLFDGKSKVTIGELRIEETPAVLEFSAKLYGGLVKDTSVEYEVFIKDSNNLDIGWFGTEFWRETGYDDGYYDESDYAAASILRIDEPGVYPLVAEVSAYARQAGTQLPLPVDVSLRVTDKAVALKPFILALMAGVAGGILSTIRSRARAESAASLGGRLAPSKQKSKNRNKRKRKGKDKGNRERSGETNGKRAKKPKKD